MAQTITLRLITRQAGGGEIIRTRTIESEEATIGRAPDSDIYLPDLSVDQDHAVLRISGQGRVSVEAIGDAPFLIDGKPALRVELEVIRGPIVTFGSFDLLLGLGGEGDIAVTVMRKEEEHAPSASLFSLKASMFGRRRMAWTLGLAILALCLVLPMAGGLYMKQLHIHPDRQWSSGPLSKSHAFLEKDCQSCHQKAFVAVRDEACLACHRAGLDPAATQKLNVSLRAAGSPFTAQAAPEHTTHDKLRRAAPSGSLGQQAKGVFEAAFNHPNDRCASCHLEHSTPAGPNAGANRPEKPTLLATNDCAACHAKLKARLPSTVLSDTPDWGRHPAFRPFVTLSPDGPRPRLQRIALTARPRESSGLIFSHAQHLDPTGGVARQAQNLGVGRGYGAALDCGSCHHLDGTLRNYAPIEMERDCGACHSLAFAAGGGAAKLLPHGDPQKVMSALQAYYGEGAASPGPTAQPARRLPGQFRPLQAAPRAASPAMATAVFRAAFSPGGGCYDCHTISWDGAGPLGVKVAPVFLAARFMPDGGFDHSVPQHRGQGAGAFGCVDCHTVRTSGTTADLSIPDIGKCASCHGKTKAQTPAAASGECADCHSFHQPGQAARISKGRAIEALRWSNVAPPAGSPPKT